MFYVPESAVEKSVNQKQISDAVYDIFVQLSLCEARNFPIVREKLNYADAIFGFKSGFENKGPLLGVKAGGLWPGNAVKGIANHQSTVVLFDPQTGSPAALVRATYLTALRTAAASSLSIRHLARRSVKSLGILGAGGQSRFQIYAALKERDFGSVFISDKSDESAQLLAHYVRSLGYAAIVCTPKTMAQSSDVIITVVPSFAPIIKVDWVNPGTHIACMGTDTAGKQELETELIANCSLFVDEAEQALNIGECQHAFRAGLITADDLVPLGQVLAGAHPGRCDEEMITAFDSTGMGLQDVAAANVALQSARDLGLAIKLED